MNFRGGELRGSIRRRYKWRKEEDGRGRMEEIERENKGDVKNRGGRE